MAYAQGGQIKVFDFTDLMGEVAVHGPNKLNTVWSSGYNNSGYGQTAIPLIPDRTTTNTIVTATQWATAINALNNSYLHQTGSGTGISPPTAGIPITYISTLASAIQTSYTNRLSSASSGSSGTSSNYSFGVTADWNQTGVGSGTRTLTWSSGDAARYFFNAGGVVGIRVVSVTNNDGTGRSQSLVTLGSNFGQKTIGAMTGAPRSGTGGNVLSDLTDKGYYQLSTTPLILTAIDSTSYYNSDYMVCRFSTNGTQGSLLDNGNQLILNLEFASAGTGGFQFDDTVNVTVNYNVYWVYPESTYLSNSWGSISVS